MSRGIRARERQQARRYRMLRVELVELRDWLRARAARPAGQFMLPAPLADRIDRMLDRGSWLEMDEPDPVTTSVTFNPSPEPDDAT